MAKCSNCISPQPSECINWTGKDYKDIDSFNELIEDIVDRVEDLEAPHEIDIKTLSDDPNLTRDEIIQVLIDTTIAKQSDLLFCEDLDIDCCVDNQSICQVVKFLYDEIRNLKNQIQSLNGNC